VSTWDALRRWLSRPADPEAEAEAKRMQLKRETIKASQLGVGGVNVPPTPDVLDPKTDR
jgi:hypothetical protein